MSAAVGPSRGPEDAPVAIVGFSDFQCSYCARARPILGAIQEDFGQKVRVVFRHYPLPFHTDATRAAEAGVCADEQGRFWEMHDKLFDNVQALQAEDIVRYAREVGLDRARFDDCLASGRGARGVERDRREGESYGVTGTPTFFVNGRFVAGAVPLDTLASMVKEELTQSNMSSR